MLHNCSTVPFILWKYLETRLGTAVDAVSHCTRYPPVGRLNHRDEKSPFRPCDRDLQGDGLGVLRQVGVTCRHRMLRLAESNFPHADFGTCDERNASLTVVPDSDWLRDGLISTAVQTPTLVRPPLGS